MRPLAVPIVILSAALILLLSMERDEESWDFVIASENEVFTLDPQRMSWLHDMRMAYALYEGLVRWNTEDFTPEPAVASSWSTSPDGLTWTFTIDPAARWSDGSPVTAHDFVWSWQRLLMPDTAADYSFLLFPIRGATAFMKWRSDMLASFDPDAMDAETLMETTDSQFDHTVGVRALGDRTLEVTLDHPVPYLLDLLAFAPMMPVQRAAVEGWTLTHEDRDALQRDGWHAITPPPWSSRQFVTLSPRTGRVQPDHRWARPGTLVGNGPYVLDRWRYRRDLAFTANPNARRYNPASLDRILVRSIPDGNAALAAFRAGDVDWLTGVSSDVRGDLLEASRQADAPRDRLTRSIHAIPAFATEFYSFNCGPTLADGRPNPFHHAGVRRAFARSCNKQELVDHVTGLHEPIAGSMTPQGSIPSYAPPEGLTYDPERALEELEEAGWQRDEQGVLVDAGGSPFPVVTLLYSTSSPRHERIAAALRDQWAERLGVDIDLEGKDSKAFGADLKAGNFMLARGNWYGDWGDPTTFLELFETTNGNNDRRFSHPTIDSELRRAAQELDPDQRFKVLQGVEQALFETHLPLLPVCQIVDVTMYDPESHTGMTTHPRLVQYLDDIRAAVDDAP